MGCTDGALENGKGPVKGPFIHSASAGVNCTVPTAPEHIRHKQILAGFEYRLSAILCITPNNLPAARVPDLHLSLNNGVNDLLCILRPDPVSSFSDGVVEGNQQAAHLAETLVVLASTYRNVVLQNPFDGAGLAQSNVAGNSQVQKLISDAFEVPFPLWIQVVCHGSSANTLATHLR